MSMRRVSCFISFLLTMAYTLCAMGQAQTAYSRFVELEKVYYDSPVIKTDNSNDIVIRINNQDEFDSINETLINKLKEGYKQINIVISSGIYFYDNDHVFLNRMDFPEASIKFKGRCTVLCGRHSCCGKYKSKKQVRSAYEQIKPNWSKMYQLDCPIEVVDMETTMCRIPNKVSLQYQEGLIIEVTEWFCRKQYLVDSITDEYIYFKAKGLTYRDDWKSYSVNLDYAMTKQYPRYRFIKPPVATIKDKSLPSRFMWVYASNLNQVSMSNIQFIGSSNNEESLLYMSSSKCKRFEIENCRFEGLANEAVRCARSNNLYFHNNVVEDCEGGALLTDNSSNNTRVENNVFNRTGLNGGMNYTVSCYGSDFIIQGNTFKDFNYAAINSGMRLKWEKPFSCSGIIEGNELFYTYNFIKAKSQYTLIDGGAIYLDSKIDHIIVRYNYIHDYTGMGHNRGVYCDDGAANIDIYGNIIANITNGDALFSWRSKGAEKQYDSANNNINVMYNIIQGTYHFDATNNSSCMKGKNLLIGTNESSKNVLDNFAVVEPDFLANNGYAIKKNKIRLSRKAKSLAKALPSYNTMKTWIK